MIKGAAGRGQGAEPVLRAELLERLISLQEQERGQIARLIHDDALQLLGASLLKVQLCARLFELGRQAEVQQELETLQSDVGRCADSLRRLMLELQPQAEGGDGLHEALALYLQHLPGAENVMVGLQPGCERFLQGWVAAAFYRLAQGALSLATPSLSGRSGWFGFSCEGERLLMAVILDAAPACAESAAADARASAARELLLQRAASWGIEGKVDGSNAEGWNCSFTLRI